MSAWQLFIIVSCCAASSYRPDVAHAEPPNAEPQGQHAPCLGYARSHVTVQRGTSRHRVWLITDDHTNCRARKRRKQLVGTIKQRRTRACPVGSLAYSVTDTQGTWQRDARAPRSVPDEPTQGFLDALQTRGQRREPPQAAFVLGCNADTFDWLVTSFTVDGELEWDIVAADKLQDNDDPRFVPARAVRALNGNDVGPCLAGLHSDVPPEMPLDKACASSG